MTDSKNPELILNITAFQPLSSLVCLISSLSLCSLADSFYLRWVFVILLLLSALCPTAVENEDNEFHLSAQVQTGVVDTYGEFGSHGAE